MVTELELAKSRFKLFAQKTPIVVAVGKSETVTKQNIAIKEKAKVTSFKPNVYVKSPNPLEILNYGFTTVSNIINPVNALDSFSKIVIGSREEKVEQTLKISPFPGVVKTVTNGEEKIQTFAEKIFDTIKEQKQTPEGKEFWETKTIYTSDVKTPDIKLPDIFGGLGDLAKYALIGGIGLLALIILIKNRR